VIFAANHQSYYDPVVISLAAGRRIIYMGLKRFFEVPLLGALMRAYGCLPVREGSRVPRAYARMIRLLRRGSACGIFPEGARTTDGLPQPPNPGVGGLALATGAPVVPVTLLGLHRVWPVGRRLPRPGPVLIRFGEPLRFGADREGSRDAGRRREVARVVMRKIVEGFGSLCRPRLARRSMDAIT
jgi:1-acyl-sn-glycerol-3-phosphate acyltransferase